MGAGALIAAFAVAGCAATPIAAQNDPVRTIEEARDTLPVGSHVPRSDTDMCRATEMQWLVGRQRSEIPVPVDVVSRRVACTTCPVTQDYAPSRLNIFYDRETGTVERVTCG